MARDFPQQWGNRDYELLHPIYLLIYLHILVRQSVNTYSCFDVVYTHDHVSCTRLIIIFSTLQYSPCNQSWPTHTLAFCCCCCCCLFCCHCGPGRYCSISHSAISKIWNWRLNGYSTNLYFFGSYYIILGGFRSVCAARRHFGYFSSCGCRSSSLISNIRPVFQVHDCSWRQPWRRNSISSSSS